MAAAFGHFSVRSSLYSLSSPFQQFQELTESKEWTGGENRGKRDEETRSVEARGKGEAWLTAGKMFEIQMFSFLFACRFTLRWVSILSLFPAVQFSIVCFSFNLLRK